MANNCCLLFALSFPVVRVVVVGDMQLHQVMRFKSLRNNENAEHICKL